MVQQFEHRQGLGGALSRTSDKSRARRLIAKPPSQFSAMKMIKRRDREAGLSTEVCCHTFRSTGIAAYLLGVGNPAPGEAAQIATYESPRTTSLHDRRNQEVELD